jgi:hypothetical protein
MVIPDNSNLQQQFTQRLLQSSITALLPTLLGTLPNANRNGLVQVLARALQQQQQQQQLFHQHTFGQDSLRLQTHVPSALFEGLTQQLLNTTNQQNHQQELLLLQRCLNQQAVLPSASFRPPPALSFTSSPPLSQSQGASLLPNDFLRGICSNYSNRSHYPSANNNILQNVTDQYALLLSMLSKQPHVGTSIAFQMQQAPQLDQLLQRSLVRQQQQLLASSLVASDHLPHHHH